MIHLLFHIGEFGVVWLMGAIGTIRLWTIIYKPRLCHNDAPPNFTKIVHSEKPHYIIYCKGHRHRLAFDPYENNNWGEDNKILLKDAIRWTLFGWPIVILAFGVSYIVTATNKVLELYELHLAEPHTPKVIESPVPNNYMEAAKQELEQFLQER